jgi:hypothetical protein
LECHGLPGSADVRVGPGAGPPSLPLIRKRRRIPKSFPEDGDTDWRGRFDSAPLRDDPKAGAVRYAVLVLHEQKGAVIRAMAPPAK